MPEHRIVRLAEILGHLIIQRQVGTRKHWYYVSNSLGGHFFHATKLEDGHYLLAHYGAHYVAEFDDLKQVVWSYGVKYSPGSGEGYLRNPRSVYRLPNGNILICDGGNNRVIEIDYSTKGISWSYSDLKDPTFAYPLYKSDNFLITDRGNHRVLEVDRSGTVVWQYGTTGVGGSGANQLYFPYSAYKLETLFAHPMDGWISISDRSNQRVIVVDQAKTIKWQYGTTGLSGYWSNLLNLPCLGRLYLSGYGLADTVVLMIVNGDYTSNFELRLVDFLTKRTLHRISTDEDSWFGGACQAEITHDDTILLPMHQFGVLAEVSLSAFHPPSSERYLLWNGQTVMTSGATTDEVWCERYLYKNLYLESDKGGTLTVEVDLDGSGRFKTLATITVSAGTLVTYPTQQDFVRLRLKFVPSAQATVSAWCNLNSPPNF